MGPLTGGDSAGRAFPGRPPLRARAITRDAAMQQCRRAASMRRRTIAGPAGKHARAGWITVIVMVALTASVGAQEAETGRAIYLENCAACHGADGRGGGAQGSRLEAKPADLTLLARRNGGAFSSTAVPAAIDGRKTLRAHRDSAMPNWGCRHDPPADARTKSSKKKSFNLFFDLPCRLFEPVNRERIRAVVHYLSITVRRSDAGEQSASFALEARGCRVVA